MTKNIPVVPKKGILQTYKAFTKDPLLFLRNYATNKHGISQFNIFHYRIIHLSHPDFIKHVLSENTGKYTQSRDRDHMKLLFGDGLLTSTGKHWQKQRAMIQPCFGKSQLEKFFAKIIRQIESFPIPVGSQIDIHQYSLDLVNRIIADIIFSHTDKSTLEIGNILVDLKSDTLKRLSNFSAPLWVPTSKNTKYKKARAFVYDGIQALVTNRKSMTSKPDDLLTFFMEAKDKATNIEMTDKELGEELLGVYAAAHEPVSIALTYALFLIAKHPEAQYQLQEELKKVLHTSEFTLEKFAELIYTKQVVQETMRLYPPVWVSGKRALQNDTINGYAIKKNDNFIFSPVILHSHPDFWENPTQFDPNRFASNKDRHPFAYIPFSGGAKHCVGSHLSLIILQVIIANTFSRFSLKTDTKEVNISPFTTLKPINKILFEVCNKNNPNDNLNLHQPKGK